MNTAVIKINSLDQALMLSRAYKEGEIKLNVSKLARELNCSRKTLSRRLNGIAPKKTRNRKRYLDDTNIFVMNKEILTILIISTIS